MKSSKDQLIEQFRRIKEFGWIESRRWHNTGIGKTFEDYMGILENNSGGPDFKEFEIKSHREISNSPITLFTKSPDFPKGANGYLRDTFGAADANHPELKKIYTSMYAGRFNSYLGRFSIRLVNDPRREKVVIEVYDSLIGRLVSDDVGYHYATLEQRLNKKLKNLMYVSADRKLKNGVEYFKFQNAEIYTGLSFEKFLRLLDEGLIQYDIRIGSHQSGRLYGRPHDHGSGFRLKESYLMGLYENKEVAK